ncbi:roadblock/LC7 domain-containing protein [Desulfoluna spongiiphila]|uniref:Roadblock/LAMTOR2 domain-containing protein n=1 Tax=Desulfoluna spongiiphila TaxID=419481 RepID=A0A1G5JAB1_9BACT|nr:roadblock/LC7 domain-containing protein [Desulfoluna spongiiphila]SCY84870.1 hypothetical protein SAMN05216233_12659 [Desulfoluna spongiiphila]
MTTILDFIKIARIKGVDSYCLVAADGRRMAGNTTHADAFCGDLARLARESAKATEDTSFDPPESLSIRGPETSLIIIPVGGYTLGITTAAETPEGPLINDVQAFLRRIRHQHTVSQKS